MGDANMNPDVALQESLKKLSEIQIKLEEIDEQASAEVVRIENEALKARRPVLERRQETIGRIPKFWHDTLQRVPLLSELLTAEDIPVLAYLRTLDVVDFDDLKSGYRID